jgi:RNA polymerase sigma factor (sigma-70 family)
MALMRASRAGDRAAYGLMLKTCEPFIRRVGRQSGVTDDHINDVVQDTLLTLHHAKQAYDPSRSFLAWLTVIARRRAVDTMRRRGRSLRRELHAPSVYNSHPDPRADPTEGWLQANRTRFLDNALASLPTTQRDAVERLALREQSLAEAAAESGRSTGAIKTNLHRALKALRAKLDVRDDPC